MPRPQRCRRICSEPSVTVFSPENAENGEPVFLTMDEFEAIRLIDSEKQTHEQCAKQMEISRSTATEIYESARSKIADSLVKGRPLVIEGGNYRLCDGNPKWCYKKHCGKKNQNEVKNIIFKCNLPTPQKHYNNTYESHLVLPLYIYLDTYIRDMEYSQKLHLRWQHTSQKYNGNSEYALLYQRSREQMVRYSNFALINERSYYKFLLRKKLQTVFGKIHCKDHPGFLPS